MFKDTVPAVVTRTDIQKHTSGVHRVPLIGSQAVAMGVSAALPLVRL